MAARLWITNVEADPISGVWQPANLPPDTPWCGNLYTKNNGNVRKYLLFTAVDISGQAGVFGPLTLEEVQAAIDADGGTLKGWTIDGLPNWAIGAVSP